MQQNFSLEDGIRLYEKQQFTQAYDVFSKVIGKSKRPATAHAWRARTAAFGLHDLNAALSEINSALTLDPGYAEAYYLRGRILLNMGQYQEAVNDFNLALAANYPEDELYYYRAVARHQAGLYPESIQDYNRAIEYNPDFAPAYYNRAEAHAALGNTNPALSDLSISLQKNPNYKEALALSGEIHFEQKNFTEALNHFKRYLGLDKKDARILYKAGLTALELKQVELACEYFTELIEVSPDFVQGWLYKGICQFQIRKPESELASLIYNFDKVLSLDPHQPLALYHRGLLLIEVGDVKAALNDFNQLLSLQPDFYRAYWHRAKVNQQLGFTQAAIDDYSQTILHQPNKKNLYLAYYNRGVLQYELGRIEEAFLDFAAAIEKNPEYAPAFLARGIIQQTHGRFGLAIDDFGRAAALEPNDPNVWLQCGQIHLLLKQWEDAAANFTKVLALEPENFEAHLNLATLLNEQGQYQIALETFEKLTHQWPNQSVLWLGLANACEKLNLTSKALNAYERYLALEKNPSERNDAQFKYALILLNTGQLQEAEVQFKELLSFNPEDATSKYYLGVCLQKLGGYEAALKAFNEFVNLEPGYAMPTQFVLNGHSREGYSPEPYTYWANKALAAYHQNNLAEAIEAFSKALSLKPKEPQLLNYRALCYSLYQKPTEAISDLSTLLTLKQDDPELYLRRGKLYLELKQYAEAIRDFDAVINLQPEHQSAPKLKYQAYSAAGDLGGIVKQGAKLLWNTALRPFKKTNSA